MEIKNVMFQDLESFGKERLFQNGHGKFWVCAWKNSRNVP